MEELCRRVTEGDIRALARVCRFLDDRRPNHRRLLQELYPFAQSAWVVGITGSPGAGKSSLTDALVTQLRSRGKRVGVVAVDPSSPFSGGAFLGDRIRLVRHFADPEVFIRSLATRGAMGGISRSTQDTIVAVAAWQAQVVIVETVGVGQDELDVTRAADTTCVVVAPGMGDDIQATKAGILESADVFAVNKADRDGADSTVRDLEGMLALAQGFEAKTGLGHIASAMPSRSANARGWTPPIVRTVAVQNAGVGELLESLESHRAHLSTTGQAAARRRARDQLLLMSTLQQELMQGVTQELNDEMSHLLDRIQKHELDPYSAAESLCRRFRGSSTPMP